MEKKEIKTMAFYASLVVLLYWGLQNLKPITSAIGYILNLIMPFILGLVFAFIANIPMSAFERTLLKKIKKQKLKRMLSIILTIFIIIAVISFVVFTVVPEISKSVAQIGPAINPFLERVEENIYNITSDKPEIIEFIENNIPSEKEMMDSIVNFIQVGLVGTLGSTINVIKQIVSGVVNVVLAFIFALYILLQKENMCQRSKRLLRYALGEKRTGHIEYVLNVSRTIFSNFISGQCLEAVILGCMFFVVMSILRMPYAPLIGTLIAVTALIPYIGSFIGFLTSLFLVFMVDPIKAFWYIVVFVILQQVEGNFIYPKVVGNSIGLPPVWVLLAVTVGTGAFGVIGLLLFIPLFSVIYTLIWNKIDGVNEKTKQNTKTKPEKTVKQAGGHK